MEARLGLEFRVLNAMRADNGPWSTALESPSKELDGRPIIVALCPAAGDGYVGCCLTRHSIFVKMTCKHRFEIDCAVRFITWSHQAARYSLQVFVHFNQGTLYVLHPLPHHILKLDMAHCFQ
jgi:hypothetical protein